LSYTIIITHNICINKQRQIFDQSTFTGYNIKFKISRKSRHTSLKFMNIKISISSFSPSISDHLSINFLIKKIQSSRVYPKGTLFSPLTASNNYRKSVVIKDKY
jgi:hypothetical protein